MADPLLELLLDEERDNTEPTQSSSSSSTLGKYISRLLSLRPSDLTTTEPQSLAQSSQSNVLALQALSSRSHKSTTASSDQLATLQEALPALTRIVAEIKKSVPQLDESANNFATTYSKSRTTRLTGNDESHNVLSQRKESILFSRQAEKLQDIFELPGLLSTAITSAASSPVGSANYGQALDLYAYIKRLDILYPDSQLVLEVQDQAEEALKEMITNLLSSLRGHNIRLAAAIRTIGWLRRIVPELSSTSITGPSATVPSDKLSSINTFSQREEEQSEGSFGALFLVARLSTYLSLTEEALAPLRDLADQESEKRIQSSQNGSANHNAERAQPVRRTSTQYAVQGQQTERYLKRYIEIFREQSFATIQMFRNIFPASSTSSSDQAGEGDSMRLPSALASFPLHLVSLLMETLQTYLPNITDVAARESLLVQVLYAANSLGRLGADFSMMIALLDLPPSTSIRENGEDERIEPEWYRVIQKHKVQAARLDALASGQDNVAKKASQDVAVR